jgi:hypothetical protein
MNNPSEPPHNLPGAELPHEQKNFSNEPQRLEQTKSEGENSEKIDTPDKKGSDQSENKTLSPSNPQRDLFILLGIFAFVILLYILSTFFSGGNGQQNSEQNPQKQQQTIAAQQATSSSSSNFVVPKQNGNSFLGLGSLFSNGHVALPENTTILSFYHGWISLDKGTANTAIYPEREYITISIQKQNLSYLDISQWSLENSAGDRYYLGNASVLPIEGQPNKETPLIVNAGDEIIVSSGPSPIGLSFRQNSCSGYLEENHDFVPEIQRRCPRISTDVPSSFSQSCRSYVQNIPQCTTGSSPIPKNLSAGCQDFINANINYNACIRSNQDNADFLSNTYRIFLGQASEIWQQPHDTITLRDKSGKIVDSISY